MLNIPKNLTMQKDTYELKSIVQIVYDRTEAFLQFPIHLHYTDHSINHSKRILKIISNLLEGSRLNLSDVEKYVIICAALLHDIGMQIPRYLTSSPEISSEDLEIIRRNHHLYSAQMIIDSIGEKKEFGYNFGLDARREYVESIALVAQAHRKIDLNSLNDLVVDDEVIRIKLLASLLRLSDCLDMTYKRVNIDRLPSLNVPVESKLYWYRHQYVKGISINNQKIQIYFSFPKEYQDEQECVNTLINDTHEEVMNQVDDVYDILYDNGLRLYKSIESNISYSATEKKMPEDLVIYIKALQEENVVRDSIFDVYPTRELCIDEILNKIEKEGAQIVIFFGGISSKLCKKNTIDIFSTWLQSSHESTLFLCYEADEAAFSRAASLNENALPRDELPTEPHLRYLQKLSDIEKCRERYPKEVQTQIYLVPITKALNTYPIVIDNSYYCNILTAVRSSESTTARMRNNSVGNKTKIELLSYMLYILDNSPKSDGKTKLINYIDAQQKTIN